MTALPDRKPHLECLLADVCLSQQTGKHLLRLNVSAFDPNRTSIFCWRTGIAGTARVLSLSPQMMKLKWIAYLCLVRSRTPLLAGRVKQLSSHRATFG